jgi:hypothetical protein
VKKNYSLASAQKSSEAEIKLFVAEVVLGLKAL